MFYRLIPIFLVTVLSSWVLSVTGAHAAKLNAYCPFADEDCGTILKAFEIDTGIQSSFVRLSAGEIVARIRAERENPQVGLWLGGPIDTFIQGAAEGLLAPHRVEGLDQVDARYIDKDYRWIPISRSPLVAVYSSQVLDDIMNHDVKVPTGWHSFADPAFQDNIALAHPSASGTGYTWIATLVQIFGEDPAFELMKKINKNVVQYTRSGVAPFRMTVGNEIALGMVFFHELEGALRQGHDVDYFFPQEGTGFEVVGSALIAGINEEQSEAAKAFLGWIVTPSGQQAMAATFRLPIIEGYENPNAQIDTSSAKLINYDFVWAGENRARLLERYDREIRRGSDVK